MNRSFDPALVKKMALSQCHLAALIKAVENVQEAQTPDEHTAAIVVLDIAKTVAKQHLEKKP